MTAAIALACGAGIGFGCPGPATKPFVCAKSMIAPVTVTAARIDPIITEISIVLGVAPVQ